MLTTRDENGELLTPLNDSKISDVVSTTTTTNLPISSSQNLSTSFESDRDSGVAIELSSCESSNFKNKTYFFFLDLNLIQLNQINHRQHHVIRLSLKYCHHRLH